MQEIVNENNQVSVTGEIISDCVSSHSAFGEGYYTLDVLVKRLSDSADVIPVMLSERMLDVSDSHLGEIIRVSGQFRSYNQREDRKSRLVLSVFARELEILKEADEPREAPEAETASAQSSGDKTSGGAFPGDEKGDRINRIYLNGYVCKPPVYRKTPLGREITDLLLAVNRPYGKSDYIPCICWGRNARLSSAFKVGGRVKVWGRIQSREYVKKLSETEFLKRTAYEVSVSKIEYEPASGGTAV